MIVAGSMNEGAVARLVLGIHVCSFLQHSLNLQVVTRLCGLYEFSVLLPRHESGKALLHFVLSDNFLMKIPKK